MAKVENKESKPVKKGTRTIANELGVHRDTIKHAKNVLGIKDEITDDDMEKIKGFVNTNLKIRERNEKMLDKMLETSNEFIADVRRIDQSEDSSLRAMLQDCKERYVANEILIQRLQNEIDQQSVLMLSNANATISAFPQLNSIERIQKLNISLRNQIVDFENQLGKSLNGKEDNDPFN